MPSKKISKKETKAQETQQPIVSKEENEKSKNDTEIENENENSTEEENITENKNNEEKIEDENKPELPLKYYVSMNDLLTFLFPKYKLHPNAMLRLYIFAEYGPLYKHHSYHTCLCFPCQKLCKSLRKTNDTAKQLIHGKVLIGNNDLSLTNETLDWLCKKCYKHCQTISHLTSGFKHMHIVSEWELKKMEEEFKRKDLLSLYMSSKEKYLVPLTIDDENEILGLLPLHIQNSIPKCNQNDIIQLLQPLARYTYDKYSINDCLSFHELSKHIIEYREYHKKQLPIKMHVKQEKQMKGPKRRSRVSVTNNKALAYLKSHEENGSRKSRKIPDCQQSQMVSSLLNTYTHEIATFNTLHSSDITQNVKLLRYLPKDSSTKWDGTCCLKNSNRILYNMNKDDTN